MNKKARKIFISIIVGIVALGLVASYIPLLFVRPEQVPQNSSQQEQIIVPITPNVTSTPTSTQASGFELEGFAGLEGETNSLNNLDSSISQ